MPPLLDVVARLDEATKRSRAVRDQAPIIATLEAELAKVFRAQALAFKQEVAKLPAHLREATANPPGDRPGLLEAWMAAWERAAAKTRARLLRPLLAAINRAFGRGEAVVQQQAAKAVDNLAKSAPAPEPQPAAPALPVPNLIKPPSPPPVAPPPIPSASLPAEPTPISATLGITFQARDPRAAAYIDQHAAELVTGIDETTRGVIHDLLSDGLANGDSPAAIADRITERFGEMAAGRPQEHVGSRAHLIAQQEVGEAYAAGQLAAATEMGARGLPMEKAWLTCDDDRVSQEICAPNEDQGWIPLAQTFQSGHDRPLGHVGCRCSLQTRMALAA